MNRQRAGERQLDDMARAAHAQALRALGPRVQAQQHNRRKAALAAGVGAGVRTEPANHRGWAWVAAPALALVLAFGMPWRTAREPAAAGARVAAAQPVEAQATLDQDPDFYLWLASSDAVALASE
jgi:hypothetical protein